MGITLPFQGGVRTPVVCEEVGEWGRSQESFPPLGGILMASKLAGMLEEGLEWYKNLA